MVTNSQVTFSSPYPQVTVNGMLRHVSPSLKVGAHVLMGGTCAVRGGGIGTHELLLFYVRDQVVRGY